MLGPTNKSTDFPTTMPTTSIPIGALAVGYNDRQQRIPKASVVFVQNHYTRALTKCQKGATDGHIGRFVRGREPPSADAGRGGAQFGFPVNGFHPQWSASANIVLAAASPTPPRASEPARYSEVVSNKISELIGRLRHDEEEKKRKRRRDAAAPAIGGKQKKSRASGAESSLDETTQAASQFSDLYSDVFVESDVPQLIVTPGGRVLAWNNEFLRITGLTTNQVAESLTVFNLVRADMIPRLFELFSLALRGGSPLPLLLSSPLAPRNGSGSLSQQQEEEENARGIGKEDFDSASSTESGRNGDVDEDDENSENSSNYDTAQNANSDEESLHASMNVPCVPFTSCGTPFNMTITLMNDIDPSKRCLHCIFIRSEPDSKAGEETKEMSAAKSKKRRSPRPPAIGRIRRVSYASLASLL